MGAHNLAVSELTEEAKGKRGKEYLDAVSKEFGDHRINEGSEEDNAQTSDKLDKSK